MKKIKKAFGLTCIAVSLAFTIKPDLSLAAKAEVLTTTNMTEGVTTEATNGATNDATSGVQSRSIRVSEKKDSLSSILKKSKFSKKEIEVVSHMAILPEDYRILPQTSYQVTYYRRSDEVDVKIYEPDDSSAYLFKKRGKNVTVESVASDLETQTHHYEGVVEDNLMVSIRHLVGDDRVAQKFLSAYLLDFTAEELAQDGAKFSFTVEKQYYGSDFIKFGEVLDCSLVVNGRVEERHLVRFPRGGAFVNLKDQQEGRPFYAPVEYIRVSSLFNPRRFHPIKRRIMPHRGVDFTLPKGEPVFAAAPGKILEIGRSRGGGNFIRIDHGDGYETNYEHLSAFETGLHPGQDVEAGDRIGRVGCTGFCTSAHLHFGVKVNGEHVDPVFYTRSFPYHHLDLVQQYFEDSTRQTAVPIRATAAGPDTHSEMPKATPAPRRR